MRTSRYALACVLLLEMGAVHTESLRTREFDDKPAGDITYSAHIRPLLDRYCASCHSGWFPDGGLRVDSIEAVLRGGKSGPGVVPGSPEKGWLIFSITRAEGERFRMPPQGGGLADEEIQLIKAWIRQGAK